MDLRGETRRTIDFGAPPPGALTWTPRHEGDVPEDRIVRGAFRHLLAAHALSPAQARALGRAMGGEARGPGVVAYLDAFTHLGLGRLTLESRERDRFVVQGHAIEGAEKARSTTCALALGFVEGAVAALDGQEWLGTEMQCRSRGAPHCSFFVRSRG